MYTCRLQLEFSNYHITGVVTHNNGTTIVRASTREFCIARYLYKTTDISASHNIGRVLAQRCLETGVNRVMWEGERTIKNNPKVHIYHIGGRVWNHRIHKYFPINIYCLYSTLRYTGGHSDIHAHMRVHTHTTYTHTHSVDVLYV